MSISVFFLKIEKGVLSVGATTAQGHLTVARLWNPQTGKLLWETSFRGSTSPGSFLGFSLATDAIALLTSTHLISLDLAGNVAFDLPWGSPLSALGHLPFSLTHSYFPVETLAGDTWWPMSLSMLDCNLRAQSCTPLR